MAAKLVKYSPEGYYTIVAPGTIQSDYEYKITVTIYNCPNPVRIKLGILGPSYSVSKTITIQSLSTEIVHFSIPTIEDGAYELQTEGISGLTFKEATQLSYKCEKPKVYIQTDKKTYKPGDLVQYRILALDENTKPAKLVKPLNVYIEDGDGNHIKELNEIQFNKGAHTGKLQLSEQPVLGSWCINVTENGIIKSSKDFDVDKYVLPKFSVNIETDKNVSIHDEVIKIIVISKYTYGKPVRGILTVSLKLKSDEECIVKKSINIIGKGEFQFDMAKELHYSLYEYVNQIKVEAVVTEDLTGIQQSTKCKIDVVATRYNMKIITKTNEYEIGQPFEIRVIIKNHNGLPVRNKNSTVTLMLSQISGKRTRYSDLVLQSKVDQNGIAIFLPKFNKVASFSNLKVKFENEIFTDHGLTLYAAKSKLTTAAISTKTEEHFGRNNAPCNLLQITAKTMDYKLNLNEQFAIDVTSNNTIPHFVYTIAARGKIVRHEFVKVAHNTLCYTIQLTATFDMFPCTKIFVYFVKDGKLHFNEISIDFFEEYQNKLEITAPEQTLPSDVVTLNIKTDPDSFVGLLGVDQSVLLLSSGNDFDAKEIFKDLNQYESYTRNYKYNYFGGKGIVPTSGWPNFQKMRRFETNGGPLVLAPGRALGLITLTNATYPKPNEFRYRFFARGGGGPRIRKDFIETWIFDDFERTDSKGMATITKKIPDTITSWVITGFSLNENSGFGMTANPTYIRVFQQFFLSTNLPYSVKRGEVISIPVVVFNYMEFDLKGTITMDNADNEYEFIKCSSDSVKKNQMTKRITVPSNNGITVFFTIRANVVGDIMLKIKAITPWAGDAIHQKLRVEPEGVTQYENIAFFLNATPNGKSVKQTLTTNIPSDYILDSEYLEFSAVGDILGPTIKNIAKLVRMPCGCGEQNMINFVPNILVLQYLDAIKADMPSIAAQAKSYMETGYQRELTYKHKDGSYSTFGEGISESNSWLTAYVARSFILARNYITIDEKVIDQALKYLLKTQKDNGQFPQTGELFYSSNQNEVGVSAYILLAILEDAKYSFKYQFQIKKSVLYLVRNVAKEDNVYTLALISLILHKFKQNEVITRIIDELMKRLQLKAINENNLKWWSNSLENGNNNIEVTAYILQTLCDREEPGKLLPIIKWLIGQRNSLGGFNSTQDTVVGLQALIKFAQKYGAGSNGGMTIQYKADDVNGRTTTKGSFKIEKENMLLLQSHVLPRNTRQINMTANGKGSALIYLSYRYNLGTPKNKPSFSIKYSLEKPPSLGQLQLRISANFIAQSNGAIDKTNMAVMEICLPSGYTTDNDSVKSISDVPQVQMVETKNDETLIVVYFNCLKVGETVGFVVAAKSSFDVAELKPSPITIYDYYNTEQRATVYYKLN